MPVAPPRPKGPPLNALRAFEAAARLGGFSAAAEELSVTPAAISQHIKALEDWAGAALFERRSKGVRLTALGREVIGDFTRAFDALGGAQHRLRETAKPKRLQVVALPSVAQLYLAPRLAALKQVFPGVTISVTALERPPNLAREMFDFSLFFRSVDPAAGQVVLATDAMTPVCVPALAEKLETPDDLLAFPLISDALWNHDWQDWFCQVMKCETSIPEGPVFSLYSMALEEALSGGGILMGHRSLIDRHLDQGRLVAPFPTLTRACQPLVLECAGRFALRDRVVSAIGLLPLETKEKYAQK
ncbi:LysR family transcriptional regulator [Martelella alba]|uniref:LysR family transcriptional regulator n=1 Tax=Martelella alba TaxID=2590451 RepID=A0A506UD50_9HYPH|nr:LysR family transcriptional regulator [Martelella alba]TPW32373.1 LysR family transcriptional regulator [Martelella alba]